MFAKKNCSFIAEYVIWFGKKYTFARSTHGDDKVIHNFFSCSFRFTKNYGGVKIILVLDNFGRILPIRVIFVIESDSMIKYVDCKWMKIVLHGVFHT